MFALSIIVLLGSLYILIAFTLTPAATLPMYVLLSISGLLTTTLLYHMITSSTNQTRTVLKLDGEIWKTLDDLNPLERQQYWYRKVLEALVWNTNFEYRLRTSRTLTLADQLLLERHEQKLTRQTAHLFEFRVSLSKALSDKSFFGSMRQGWKDTQEANEKYRESKRRSRRN